jgi:hypothetical protein
VRLQDKIKLKRKRGIPLRFHFDRRIRQIMATNIGEPDDLLDSKQLADLFGVSVVWVEIARCHNYGPKFEKLGPRCIRYTRANITKFCQARLRVMMGRGV